MMPHINKNLAQRSGPFLLYLPKPDPPPKPLFLGLRPPFLASPSRRSGTIVGAHHTVATDVGARHVGNYALMRAFTPSPLLGAC